MIVRVKTAKGKVIMLCEDMEHAARLTRGMRTVSMQTVREEDLTPDEKHWLETQRKLARKFKL